MDQLVCDFICKYFSWTHHSPGIVVQSLDDHHEGAEEEREDGEGGGGKQEKVGLSQLLQERDQAGGQGEGAEAVEWGGEVREEEVRSEKSCHAGQVTVQVVEAVAPAQEDGG